MTKLTVTAAAKAVGISRQAMYRRIDQGKITVERDADGVPMIDTSELLRAFGSLDGKAKRPAQALPAEAAPAAVSDAVTTLQAQIGQLQAQLDAERAKADQARLDADRWHDHADRLTRLLESSQGKSEAPARRGLWSRITGRD